MIAEFIIDNEDNEGKRIVFIPAPDCKYRVMYDNGSTHPVWTSGLTMFLDEFPDATKHDRKMIVAGFGGPGHQISDVYVIPEFKLDSKKESLVLHNLVCAIADRRDMNASLILPGNIFSGMVLTEDRTKCGKVTFALCSTKRDQYVVSIYKPLTSVERKLFGLKDSDEIISATSSFATLE